MVLLQSQRSTYWKKYVVCPNTRGVPTYDNVRRAWKTATHEVLVCEGKGGRNASLKVDPLEDCRPIRVTELLGSLCRVLNLATNNHVLVLDVVSFNIADQAFEGTLCFVVLTFRAQPC